MKSLTDFLKGFVHTTQLLTEIKQLYFGETTPQDKHNAPYVQSRVQLYQHYTNELLRLHDKSPAYNSGRDLALNTNKKYGEDARSYLAKHAQEYLAGNTQERHQHPHPEIIGAAANAAIKYANQDSKAISTHEAETYHVTPVHAATRQ